MALQIEWTDKALENLFEILNYWEERNGSRNYSLKLYQMFLDALEVLSKYPQSGIQTDNILLRKKTVRDYYIYFSIDESHLTVMGISDARRSSEYLKSMEE